jgi:hypothetical protein
VEKKVWLTSDGGQLTVTKTEPVSIGLNVAVAVRSGDGEDVCDGVWLNGERSFDTSVMVDGDVRFHSSAESVAEESFERHEAAGGGQLL